MGARELINDSLVHPIRGQILRVSFSSSVHSFVYDDFFFIPVNYFPFC